MIQGPSHPLEMQRQWEEEAQTLAVVCLAHLRPPISTYEGPLPRLVYLLRGHPGRLGPMSQLFRKLSFP